MQQLKQPETWMVLGLIFVFLLMAFLIVRLALRSDNILRALRPGIAICRELGEKSIAFVFISGFFFVLCALTTIGELFTFIDSKRRRADFQAKEALKGFALWGSAALTIGSSTILFLDVYCH